MIIEEKIISEMGLFSQFVYLDFGISPIVKQQSVSQFVYEFR